MSSGRRLSDWNVRNTQLSAFFQLAKLPVSIVDEGVIYRLPESLMIKTVAAVKNGPGALALCETFYTSDALRGAIDRRIMNLPPGDLCREILWQELEVVIATLDKVVQQLSKTSASHLPGLRAKAAVLAKLLEARVEDDDGASLTISDNRKLLLALSLAHDIVALDLK